MCPHNSHDDRRGRPICGYEEKSVVVKARIEPYLDNALSTYCKMLGVTKSEAIRLGVKLFIEQANRAMKGK